MEFKEINIQEIPGFQIGNAEWQKYGTGCTVILPEHGAVTGLDVRGGGPASRESALLNPLAANDCVNAVLLTGGSAYGLAAADGVMKYLEEKKEGFRTAEGVVPIVCTSCLYDLEFIDAEHRPDASLGVHACMNAGNYQDGNHGAGTGATVGKILGSAHMMKSGIGSYALKCGSLIVGALTAVNAAGNVVNAENGRILAGIYKDGHLLDAEKMLVNALAGTADLSHTNTTLGVILTNASFNKTELTKIAGMAHDGYARAIRPVHTMYDGDSIYAMSKGDIKADINVVGTLAAMVMEKAIHNAVMHAEKAGGILCAADIKNS